MLLLPIFLTFFLWVSTTYAQEIDCSEAYGGKSSKCEKISCDEKYSEFIGTWEGPFLSFADDLSLYDKKPDDGIAVEEIHVFRPYFNSITYSPNDCLKNLENGDTFIIGRRTDLYPEFTSINFNTGKLETLKERKKLALLVTGKKDDKDKTPFLRTIDNEFGLIEYRRIEENKNKNLSVWESVDQNWGVLTVSDGQDFSDPNFHKRNVAVKMKIGKWEGIIGKGFHSKISN
ncbi:MAG: hypothetical protein AB7H97_04820 [Pseudobdellovibrionaceae bacterium]